jgi:alpha-beta hydrolase superfamily lysophospholipase
MSELFERSWPVTDAKAGVVIVHGLGEHSGRYEHVAAALNAAGYAAYAQDVRGHGRSVGAPGDMGTDADAVINDVVEFVTRHAANHDKLFLLAHSMGTMLSLPAVPRISIGLLDGLILSGCALEPGAAAADLITNGAVPPETLSRDEAVVKAYIDDPLVWDTVPPEVFGHTIDVGQKARDAIALIQIPVLLLHGVDDKLCDIQGSNLVHTELVITDKTLIGYEGLRHEILNEPEKDKVLADLIGWLDDHLN